MRLFAALALIVLFVFAIIPVEAQKSKGRKTSTAAPGLAQLETMTARFAPTTLRVDTSKLSAGDRQALVKLIEAGRIMDDIFLNQYWSGDAALLTRLRKEATTPLVKARLRYFVINKGPWSILGGYKAFLPGVPAEKLKGANFYPADMSRGEFETWVATLSKEDQEQAKGFFTVIRRKTDGGAKTLVAVPYSEEYKADLNRAADLLKEAADLMDNDSLKKFLKLRADAFLSNDSP